MDDTLGFGWKMRLLGRERIGRGGDLDAADGLREAEGAPYLKFFLD